MEANTEYHCDEHGWIPGPKCQKSKCIVKTVAELEEEGRVPVQTLSRAEQQKNLAAKREGREAPEAEGADNAEADSEAPTVRVEVLNTSSTVSTGNATAEVDLTEDAGGDTSQ